MSTAGDAGLRDAGAEHAVQSSPDIRLLLVSPVGFAHGWAPMNIARLRGYLARQPRTRARTLSLCVRFTRMLARERPDLVQHDREMGEWGSSFHELYFGARYFGHEEPATLIRDTVADLMAGRDIYRAAPWEPHRRESDALIEFQSRSILEFSQLIEEFSICELRRELERFPADVVGFSVMAQQLTTSAFLARWVKAMAQRTTIVFGGPAILARTAPAYRELFSEVDYFVAGDGEDALARIVATVRRGTRISGSGILGPESRIEEVRTSAPRPAIAEIPSLEYEEDGDPFAGMPLTTWFGRGCSWGKCVFCAIPEEQRRLDNRPVDAVYREILALHERHGTRRFRFGDWEVNGSRAGLMAFCQQVTAGEHDFEFWAEVNARHLDRELVAAMKAAGFVSLQVGLEAFSDPLLHKMKKPATLVDNVHAMKLAHTVGMELFSNLLFNTPGEADSDILESLRTVKTLRHLLGPPVSLMLIEFLMEIDADAYRAAASGIGDAYAFESRCFPADAGAPHFLRAWRPPRSPLWASVQRELEDCRRKPYCLSHVRHGSSLYIRDGRGLEGPEEYSLTGLAAAVYEVLAEEILTVHELGRRFPDSGPDGIEAVLDRLHDDHLVVRSGRRWLGLGLPETTDIDS